MDVDADRLTEILASRLAAIVPDGFHVRASGGMLWYSGEPGRFPGQLSDHQAGTVGTFVRDNLEASGEITEERLTGVVAQALDELQDYVDEASHDPWPGTRTPPRSFAQVRDQVLRAWYGGPDITSPVILACAPIPLAQIECLP
jgi:hypothetical protein